MRILCAQMRNLELLYAAQHELDNFLTIAKF